MKILESIDALRSKNFFSCLTCEQGSCAWNESFCRLCWAELRPSFRSRNMAPLMVLGTEIVAVASYEAVWARFINIVKRQPKGFLARDIENLIAVICEYWALELKTLNLDGVIAVPSHPVRGYFETDLSAYLALNLARLLECPLIKSGLKYPKKRILGLGQKFRTRKSREALLLEEAFEVSPQSDLAGKRLLLVDDVCTTGLSLQSCRKALEKKGAHVVSAFVLAHVPS